MAAEEIRSISYIVKINVAMPRVYLRGQLPGTLQQTLGLYPAEDTARRWQDRVQ